MTESELGTLRLKPSGPNKTSAGHPWILSHEIAEPLGIEKNGHAVVARTAEGQLLGTGFYREGARIIWRRFRSDLGEFDRAHISSSLLAAVALRKKQPCRRLIWAEADHFPGLVLDQYGKYLVAQITTDGMEQVWGSVQEEIIRILQPEGIWIRRDAAGRKLEGLDELPGIAWGELPPEPIRAEIAGLVVPIDLRGGQKTGSYLDQQENYSVVGQVAQGRKVLDLFCHNGGFALRAAKAGALAITGVDSSQSSLALARIASEENNLRIRWVQDDVTRFLRSNPKKEYGLVILDPPGMVKSRGRREAGGRVMAELHRQAIRVLHPGGLLATFSCSHRVGGEELLGMAKGVAREEGRTIKIHTNLMQAADHPTLPFFPESRYLSGFLLEVS